MRQRSGARADSKSRSLEHNKQRASPMQLQTDAQLARHCVSVSEQRPKLPRCSHDDSPPRVTLESTISTASRMFAASSVAASASAPVCPGVVVDIPVQCVPGCDFTCVLRVGEVSVPELAAHQQSCIKALQASMERDRKSLEEKAKLIQQLEKQKQQQQQQQQAPQPMEEEGEEKKAEPASPAAPLSPAAPAAAAAAESAPAATSKLAPKRGRDSLADAAAAGACCWL